MNFLDKQRSGIAPLTDSIELDAGFAGCIWGISRIEEYALPASLLVAIGDNYPVSVLEHWLKN